jgi:hypothetical protein
MVTFEDIVALTADLPMVGVGSNYGTPAVQVRGKAFARMWSDREYARDGVEGTEVLVLWCELEEKPLVLEALVGVCFETTHYNGHGAFLVRLADIEPDDLYDLLEDSYRLKAPRTALKELDARG